MSQEIRAIYENGLFRPLDPVSLAEHDMVSLVVTTPANGRPATSPGVNLAPDSDADELLDQDVLAWAAQEGDQSVSLEDVRARLSKIQGSFAEAVIADRGEF